MSTCKIPLCSYNGQLTTDRRAWRSQYNNPLWPMLLVNNGNSTSSELVTVNLFVIITRTSSDHVQGATLSVKSAKWQLSLVRWEDIFSHVDHVDLVCFIRKLSTDVINQQRDLIWWSKLETTEGCHEVSTV